MSKWQSFWNWIGNVLASFVRQDASSIEDRKIRRENRMDVRAIQDTFTDLYKRQDEKLTLASDEIRELTKRVEKAEEKLDECEEKHKICEAMTDVLEQRITGLDQNHKDCEERAQRLSQELKAFKEEVRGDSKVFSQDK